MAYDEATGTLGYHPILAVWVHVDPLILRLTINGELIETTPNHPFRLVNGEWVAAATLQVGDQVQGVDGRGGHVEAIAIVSDPQPMYNLTVAMAHTYFVGDGRWLVHNTCFDIDVMSRAGSQMDRNGLTRAGRALQKHGDRAGSVFPKSTGSAGQRNALGQQILDEILTDPGSSFTIVKRKNFGEVLEVWAPNRRGARFSKDGKHFIGFLEP